MCTQCTRGYVSDKGIRSENGKRIDEAIKE